MLHFSQENFAYVQLFVILNRSARNFPWHSFSNRGKGGGGREGGLGERASFIVQILQENNEL
jgi:hypothetical protein